MFVFEILGLTTSTSSSLINCWSSSSPLQDYLPEKSKEYTTPLLIPSLSSSSLSSFHLFHNNSDDLLTSTYKVDHLPAVHIQLYLSENSRRLDVLIKHARCLVSFSCTVFMVLTFFNHFLACCYCYRCSDSTCYFGFLNLIICAWDGHMIVFFWWIHFLPYINDVMYGNGWLFFSPIHFSGYSCCLKQFLLFLVCMCTKGVYLSELMSCCPINAKC